jgi:two-component system NtrC family sensor kinase
VGNEPPSVPPSESELERFFDLGLDLLVILGFDGYFTQVNPAAEPFPEFLHPDDVQRTIDAFADVKSGNDVIGFENRYRCADGSVRWIQ